MLYYTIVHQNTCSVPCPCKILSILSSCFELVIITSACTCSFTGQDRKKKIACWILKNYSIKCSTYFDKQRVFYFLVYVETETEF